LQYFNLRTAAFYYTVGLITESPCVEGFAGSRSLASEELVSSPRFRGSHFGINASKGNGIFLEDSAFKISYISYLAKSKEIQIGV